MDAAELDRLVAQIGEEILARTNRLSGLPPKGEGLNIPDLVCPGCTQRCPQTCARKAKEIVKAMKDSKLKVQAAIQGDLVRISGKDRDTLQQAIAVLRGADFGIELQFINFRTN